LASAFAQARQNGHTVLLDFGNNTYLDARVLGRLDRNPDIAAKWDVKITTVPTVPVLSPPGRLLNLDDTAGLANARAMSAQAVVVELGKMARR